MTIVEDPVALVALTEAEVLVLRAYGRKASMDTIAETQGLDLEWVRAVLDGWCAFDRATARDLVAAWERGEPPTRPAPAVHEPPLADQLAGLLRAADLLGDDPTLTRLVATLRRAAGELADRLATLTDTQRRVDDLREEATARLLATLDGVSGGALATTAARWAAGRAVDRDVDPRVAYLEWLLTTLASLPGDCGEAPVHE